jgi:hypothetical protein
LDLVLEAIVFQEFQRPAFSDPGVVDECRKTTISKVFGDSLCSSLDRRGVRNVKDKCLEVLMKF